MLGAIIGDLAAWTYEHDRKAFWHQLVSEEAKVSEFGMSVLATVDLLQSRDTLKELDRMVHTASAICKRATKSLMVQAASLKHYTHYTSHNDTLLI